MEKGGGGDYSSSIERLITYRGWPDYAQASSIELSESGLYYTGVLDIVKCFSCAVELKDWKFTDNVVQRHKAASPNCVLIIGQAQLDITTTTTTPTTTTMPTTTTREADILPPPPPPPPPAACTFDEYVSSAPPSSSSKIDFKIFRNRLKSFRNCCFSSPDSPVRPFDLAKAGFYFLGPQDRVQCPWCYGILYSFMAGDNPLEEHMNHFDRCQFIIKRYYAALN
jgi:baculoviral IAP repeat-containing protein 2/3